MPDWEQAPLEAGFYPTVDDDDVRALRATKNDARTQWRRSLVELWSATRPTHRADDDDAAIEAHDRHLGALHDWKTTEAAYIAARLGFRHEPPARRR